MKKKALLILPLSFMLCSCSLVEFSIGDFKPFEALANFKIGEFQPFKFLLKESNGNNDNKPDSGSVTPSGDEPSTGETHATSISATPNAPFYLKVGETTNVSVSLSPSTGVAESEKLFRWELQGDNITCDLSTTDKKISIEGKKAGSCTLTATNTYNVSLYKTFTINVIDFDEDKDYLWQYSSSDRAQFGYNSTDAKQGTAEGDAVLAGKTWHYERHDSDGNNITTSLQSTMGSIGFGKGSEPETHLHFETENSRQVNKITLEAGSAHGLAKMTIKVGDIEYMKNETVPYPSSNTIKFMPEVTGTSTGKIEIDVVTPDYDPTQVENPDYYAPGAFYLKSILINFNETVPDENLTLVKSATDFTAGGRYLIVGKSSANAYYCLDPTQSSSTKIKETPFLLSDLEFGDTVSLDGTITKFGINLSFDENDKILLTTDANKKIGTTAGTSSSAASLSVTDNPAITGWSYSVASSGLVDLTIVDGGSRTRHFGLKDDASKFDVWASATNTYFFKFN